MSEHRLSKMMRFVIAGTVFASAVLALRGEDRTPNQSAGLTISVTSLSFTAVAGGSSPSPQKFTVTASRSTRFSVSASAQTGRANWLSVSPGGNLTTNQTLTVSVTPGSLAAGTYSGSILITSNEHTTTIPVSLVITTGSQPSTLSVSPASLVFNATSGGSTPHTQSLSVTASTRTSFTASASGVSGNTSWLSVSPSSGSTNTSLTVLVNQGALPAATYAGSISLRANGTTTTVPVSLVLASSGGAPPPPTNTGYKLIGWNDLGMHCFDGQDYSIFAVLPPFNTIHVHLVDSAGKLVTVPSGYTVTYQAVNDPLTNTLNTSSIGKTNFWQYAAQLGFGILAPDIGLKGWAMPGASNTPQSMTFSSADNTWEAVGIPITPYADSNTTPRPVNYFPMMRLTAKNSSGNVLATTDIVLPTSDEMACATCHASTSSSAAAKPAAGWALNSDPAKDVKLNILRKHDDRFKANALFQSAAAAFGYSPSGLEATTATRPILCGTCHATNALSLNGYAGVPPLTTAMHNLHSGVTDPATGSTLEAGTTRSTCYGCHPGAKTQCLRGAMATLKTSTGANEVECQSCHGTMSTVAAPGRQGWLDEPSCQMCHTGTALSNSGQIVYASVFSSGTTRRIAADQTFATNPNTPSAGVSLYRFSAGHGGLQCEACHNSTHAEYATPIVNDNVQSSSLQGHAGTISECAACHGTVPTTTTGGPHGLHPIGTSWVSRHESAAESGRTQCQACHGTDYRGTILSRTLADRTLAGRSFPKGTVIGCYSCHNGPNGG